MSRSLRRVLHRISMGALACDLTCDQTPPSQAVRARAARASESSPAVGVLRSGLDAASGATLVEFDLSHGLGGRAGRHVPVLWALAAVARRARAVVAARRGRSSHARFIRLGGAPVDGAQAEEVGRLFAAQKPEHPVVCHPHGYSNTTLFLAARGCDKVWLGPAGEVGTVGIAGRMVYLQRLQVKAAFLHMGKYTSFSEMFTDGPTEGEWLATVLGSIRGTWLDGLDAASPTEELRHDVEHGAWSPEAALAGGLIDSIGLVCEARDRPSSSPASIGSRRPSGWASAARRDTLASRLVVSAVDSCTALSLARR